MDAVNMNFLVLALAALIPLVMGFLWYNPKVMGNAWIKSTGLAEEELRKTNMAVIFIMTYIFSFLIAMALMPMVIHQFGVMSVFVGETGFNDPNSEPFKEFSGLMAKYGTRFRTFKHGMLHGCIASIFFALPILGINALFERKSAKYILIHLGYWFITLGLMGGVICQFN